MSALMSPAPLSEVTAIVRHLLNDNSIELDDATRFDEFFGLDSMDLISVVVEAECRYGILFEIAEIDQIVTAGDLARMIETKQMVAAA